MKPRLLLYTLLLITQLSSGAEPLELADSMRYASALRQVLSLAATHVTFDTDGAVVGIAGSEPISDKLASALHEFPRLKTLRIMGNNLSSNGIRELLKLGSIEELSIVDATLSDSDLAGIAMLTHLSYLEVANDTDLSKGKPVRLTASAIPSLGQCKSLKRLILPNTDLNAQDFRRLRRLLPNATIDD